MKAFLDFTPTLEFYNGDRLQLGMTRWEIDVPSVHLPFNEEVWMAGLVQYQLGHDGVRVTGKFTLSDASRAPVAVPLVENPPTYPPERKA